MRNSICGLRSHSSVIMQGLHRLKTDENKQKNPNGLLPAVRLGQEIFYESGVILEIL